jgi:signal transduction histidine kinase
MSSGIAAPIGGRLLRARTLGFESARERERRNLRRHLRVTTLNALEDIASSGADMDAGELAGIAEATATELRTLVTSLASTGGRSAVAELRVEVGAMLHDTALQALEYLACDGYGADLTAEDFRRIAGDTAVELRGTLLRLGTPEPCELVTGLQQVVASAQMRSGMDVELVVNFDGRLYGSEAAALVGAAREALNNVQKHAHATHVVVRCENVADGVSVSVCDNGIGADLDCVEAGIGLRHSIVDRMTANGGNAHIDSAPGQGTLVTLTTGGTEEVAA